MNNINNESMNKYIAGLFDGDGTITYRAVKKSDNHYTLGLKLEIITEHKNKHILYEIKEYFKVGNIYEGKYVTYVVNTFSHIEAIFNRIKKHLIIKGTHFLNLIEYIKVLKEKPIIERYFTKEELIKFRTFVKESRKNTKSIKAKNFVSKSWLAGFIDADGNIQYRKRKMFCKKANKQYERTDFALRIELAIWDYQALKLIQKSFNGNLLITGRNTASYTLALGKYSNNITRSLMKALVNLLKVKYKKYNLEQIIHYINRRD